MKILVLLISLSFLTYGASHSILTDPQPFSPWYCSEEDEGECLGPCDRRIIEDEDLEVPHEKPESPARLWKRGQVVRIKYTRNNHRAGGFLRLALVSPSNMMSFKAHERGSFHYSCWGAKVQEATEADKREDEFGYIGIGNDGEEGHGLPPAYNYVDVKIPRVFPDGNYVLGFVWYGGTAGPVTANKAQNPVKFGESSDWWSCSYIKIRGGKSLKRSYRPRFVNDLSHFSEKGCRSINNAPSMCPAVPCDNDRAFYRKPKPFVNGKLPPRVQCADYNNKNACNSEKKL